MALIPDYVHDSTARILAILLPLFARTPGGIADGDIYARYRRTLARLTADPRAAARSGTLAADLAQVADGYRLASDDARLAIDGLERVATAARAVQPVAGVSVGRRLQAANEISLSLLIECLAVASHGAAIGTLTPRSYDEARRLRQRFGRSCDLAGERASDFGDIATARALRALGGAVARDMIERGRPLARVVGYQTTVPLPAVVLAHLLYQDGNRADELAAENAGHDHPSFMPTAGRAYSR